MGSPVRILVVDDSDQLRSALDMLIRAHDDFEVVGTARDGDEAVSLARAEHPDVVLMDIRMPVMDGVEATRRILSELPGTSVVAHTAYDDAELVADMVKAGARGYLVKGATADELFDGLTSAVSGESRISASATRGLFDELNREGRRGVDADTEILAAKVNAHLRSDGLTGALNRSLLQHELEDAVESATTTGFPMVVGIARLGALRETNARHGWESGDAVLREVVAEMLEVVGTRGAVGRVDGDEIAAVLPYCDARAGERLLESLRDAILTTVKLEGQQVKPSFGYAALDGGDPGGADADLVLSAARKAAEVAAPGDIRAATEGDR